MMTKHGLSDDILAGIHKAAWSFPEITKIDLFGSRALGTYKDGSDIDLVVYSHDLDDDRYQNFWALLDGLPIVLKLDVVHAVNIKDDNFKTNIQQTSTELFPRLTRSAHLSELKSMSFDRLRREIYDRFDDSADQRFFKAVTSDKKRYAQYYTSMNLLQDTYESTQYLCEKGFSSNPHQAYIDVWGFMQAIFVSQSALIELYLAATEQSLKVETESFKLQNPHWRKIRNLRNEVIGYPSNKGNEVFSFFGRMPHNISDFRYERCVISKNSESSELTHPSSNLIKMRSDYFIEACRLLVLIIKHIDHQIRER